MWLNGAVYCKKQKKNTVEVEEKYIVNNDGKVLQKISDCNLIVVVL